MIARLSARSAIALAMVLAGAVVVVFVARRVTPGRVRCEGCNVILVTFDSLRADRLGAYGYARPTSPYIDALAQRSFVFTRNLSQSGSTITSVPSIHTSKFASADLLLDDGVLRPQERTLAEILREAGYATIAVIAHEYARCRWGACQGFETTDDVYEAPEHGARTIERTLPHLDASGRPFFLWIHFRQPHAPYDADAEAFAAMYDSSGAGPTFYSPDIAGVLLPTQLERLNAQYAVRGERILPVRMWGGLRRVTPTVIRQLAAMYDASVQESDLAFGRLLEHVAARGLARRTVVVVAADHGESLGGHGLIDHNQLWYVVLHTPLIVHVPGAAHAVSDRPTMNVDILPTILDVIGLQPPERIRGLSVFGAQRHAVQFAESSSHETVVRGDLRLHTPRVPRSLGVFRELFDCARDPAEEVNLIDTQPALVRDLESALDEIRRHDLAIDPNAPDTDVEKKLRDLGYIE